jgi:hypothetical protein
LAFSFLSHFQSRDKGSSWVPSGTYGNGTGYDLYIWNEPCWTYQLNTAVAPTIYSSSIYLRKGRGYLYSTQALNPTKEFVGLLNNGNSFPITNTSSSADAVVRGFNLIGNPYPSIDWKSGTGWLRTDLVVRWRL